MAIPLTVNGAVFEYPVDFDENWGVDATGWAQAVTNGMLQMAGGSFPLTSNVNFGPNFGLLSQYFQTRSASPATVGTVRLSSADAGVAWRNNANSGNLILTTNASDQLLYNGNPIATGAGGAVTSIIGTANQVIASSPTGAVTLSLPQDIAPASSPTFASLTLTAPLSVANGGTGGISHTAYALLAGGTTSTDPIQSVASVGLSGQVLTSNGVGMLPTFQNTTGSGTVNSGTANQLAYYATSSATVSGLTSITANRALSSDANGLPVASTTTATELGYVNGVTSAIQTQLDAKAATNLGNLSSPVANVAINMGAHKITNITPGLNTGEAVVINQDASFTSVTIFGGLHTTEGLATTLANGANNNITLASSNSFFSFVGGGGSATLNGMGTTTSDGPVAMWNNTGSSISIIHESLSSTSNFRITTGGSMVTWLTGTVKIFYYSSSRWRLVN